MTAWDELLDEFRALGGTAENIRLGHGEFGRGLFPMDAAKPVAIHIPDNLLVAMEHMVIAGGVPRVGQEANTGEREKAWLDRYQEEFAWGRGGVDEVRRTFEMAAALPAELRQSLLGKYRCGLWFAEPTDTLIATKFLQARAIRYRGQSVVMPIIEMANHGGGAHYDTDSGVGLRGSFPGEVLVEYSLVDSYDYFLSYGFATQRPVAFSLELRGTIDSVPLEIGDQFTGDVSSERSWIPQIEKKHGNVALPFLMLGNQHFPRLPKGIFYRLLREAGYRGFVESFDLIQHVNRLHFVNLLIELEGIDLPIARTVRAMAHYQLRALSYCYGAREI